MSTAMIQGLLNTGTDPNSISVSDPSLDSLQKFTQLHHKFSSNNEAFLKPVPAQVLILCVKPQVMKQVLHGLSELILAHRPLIISIAAGITAQDISTWSISSNPSVGTLPEIVRVMPNTPALVNQGASGLYAMNCRDESKEVAFKLMQSISKVLHWVDKEELIDTVTAISGSGPAYFFLLVECLVDAGVKAGLDYQVAKELASQTCLGAGQMLMNTSDSPALLRKKVTSPQGTTEAGIKTMEANGLRQCVLMGAEAARKRSEELGCELGRL